MTPEDDQGLGVHPMTKHSSREWVDITLASFQNYPDPSLNTFKNQGTDPSVAINRYPTPAYRVNQDGLVVMRGLICKTSLANIAAGDVVMSVPPQIRPRHPQEIRFMCGNTILAYKPDTGNLVVSDPYTAANWLTLNNVIYYID